MAKKCALCGRNASFIEGGGYFRGKPLCMECYDKAAIITDEEELKAMGLDYEETGKQDYEGQSFISALRILAWISLLFYFISTINIWTRTNEFLLGLGNLLIGAIIFVVLYVFSYIGENISMIRLKLESRDKEEK